MILNPVLRNCNFDQLFKFLFRKMDTEKQKLKNDNEKEFSATEAIIGKGFKRRNLICGQHGCWRQSPRNIKSGH